MPGISAKVVGDLQIGIALGQLDQRAQRAELQAVRQAARIVARAEKELAPRDVGTLQASIATRAFISKKHHAVAVIGPRRGLARVRNAKGRWRRATKAERAAGISRHQYPAFYGRMVNFGYRIAAGGALRPAKGQVAAAGVVVGEFAGTHFAERAVEATREQVRSTIREELTKAVARAG